MRYIGLALAASAVVLAACARVDQPAKVDSPTVAPQPAAVAMAPITGTTHTINMVGDAKGFRFEPADITVKAGDGIKFVTVSGQPHNVAFAPVDIPADVKPQLMANMPNTVSELTSPMLMNPGQDYTISFGNVKPGKYPYNCPIHAVNQMKGTITVE